MVFGTLCPHDMGLIWDVAKGRLLQDGCSTWTPKVRENQNVYTYMYIYIHTHVYLSLYIYIYVCIYIDMYIAVCSLLGPV